MRGVEKSQRIFKLKKCSLKKLAAKYFPKNDKINSEKKEKKVCKKN